jgi:hypothetical protein
MLSRSRCSCYCRMKNQLLANAHVVVLLQFVINKMLVAVSAFDDVLPLWCLVAVLAFDVVLSLWCCCCSHHPSMSEEADFQFNY